MDGKNCKVTIKSNANGVIGNMESTGFVFEENGRLKIKYTLEGDECELSVKGSNVVQTRKGGATLGLEFEEGKKTQCLVKLGNQIGKFDIFTRSFKISKDESGIKIDLEYDGADEKPVSLSFAVIYISEKK